MVASRSNAARSRTPDGGATFTECLVPKWEVGELTPDQPCARQPCLHRIVADCPPEKDAILDLAGNCGLLTGSIAIQARTRQTGSGQCAESRAARSLAAGDSGTESCGGFMGPDRGRGPARRRDARTETGCRSRPRPVPSGRRARERIGLPDALPARHSPHRSLATARRGSCRAAPVRPLPRARLWPLVPQRRASRSDRQFCSKTCKVRAFRRQRNGSYTP